MAIIPGTSGDDSLQGGAENDSLYGGAGNDTLTGGAGNDALYGESGNDIFDITANDFGTDRFFGGDGADSIRLRVHIQSSSVLWNSSYLDSVEQLNFNYYTLSGTTGNDLIDISGFSSVSGYRQINLGDGNDTFRGFGGDDLVDGGTGSDSLYGGAGDDTLTGGAGNDALHGESGNDIFDITASDFGTDSFFGGDGADSIRLRAHIQSSSILWNSSYLNSVEQLNFNYYTLSGTTGNDLIDISGFSSVSGYRQINLGDGNDTFRGFGGWDLVDGGTGSDSLYGGAGDDTLTGGAGNDALYGESGNDIFDITANDFGTDRFFGGDGADSIRLKAHIQSSSILWNSSYLNSVEQLNFNYYTLSGTTGNDRVDISGFSSVSGYRQINLGDGNDTFRGFGGWDLVDGGTGSDSLYGGAGSDTLIGGAGNDFLYGESGDDVFDITASDFGNDRFFGGDGADSIKLKANIQSSSILWNNSFLNSVEQLNFNYYTLAGTTGNDRIDISSFSSVSGYRLIELGGGNDTFIGYRGNDYVDAGAGNDTLIGGAGNDTLNGGAGSDTGNYASAAGTLKIDLRVSSAQAIGGGQGSDTLISIENLSGSRFADSLIGNGAANQLLGNAGNDSLNGLAGNDRLIGGAGNDTLLGGVGNDTLNGGDGSDTANYASTTGAIKVDLRLAGAQAIGGGQGSDTLASIENLVGSGFADRLFGNAAANQLVGNAGNDTLNGLAGNDRLVGGAGKDMLTGGVGADTFVFNTLQESGKGATRDVITDFVSGVDTLQLSAIDANTTIAGNQAFNWAGAQASAYSVWSVQSGNSRIVRGDTNGDGVFDFEIQLGGVSHLTANDFIL